MAKKKARKQAAQRPAPRPQPFSFGRFYRHNQVQVYRVLLYIGGGILAIGLIWGAYSLISNYSVSLSKEEYVTLAREQMILGNYDKAVLNYHLALNATPDDKLLQRESYLARSRDNMSRGSSVELVQASAQQLLNDFPNSLLGKISLAQVMGMRGDVSGMYRYGSEARQQAIASNDTLALMAADLALATYYRTKEQQDSAFNIGNEALVAARAVNDPYHIALVEGGLGFAAVRIDSLEFAKRVFNSMLDYQGEVAASFHDVAYSGLADYYHRNRMYDSAKVALGRLGHVINTDGVDGTRAYALHVLGRVLRDTGQLDSAAVILSRSLDLWRTLQSPADVIDNLNDLGSANRMRENFFDARKYYTSAGILADKLGFKDKNLYTADMNLHFLKALKPQDYVRAGDEGKAWAEAFAGK